MVKLEADRARRYELHALHPGEVLDVHVEPSEVVAAGTPVLTIGDTAHQQAMQMSVFMLLPSLLLSGFMFPFDAMPRFAQVLGEGLPLTHFLRIVRGIALKGAHFADLYNDLVALSIILGVLVTISALRLRKKLD